MVFDAHVHFDPSISGGIVDAVKELDKQMKGAGITKVLALHLECQPWTPEEVSDALKGYEGILSFVNIHPTAHQAEALLEKCVTDLGFSGLKLHPRLQSFGVDDPDCINLCRLAGNLRVPVLIDAFPDGTHLMQGFNPLSYARLAQSCSQTKFVWAHMGGHKVLDFMMLAKRLDNVYMDMSYSLLYYRGSSVTGDLLYAMKSMRYKKIFYGSDYPDRSLLTTLDETVKLFDNSGFSRQDIERLLFENAEEFYL